MVQVHSESLDPMPSPLLLHSDGALSLIQQPQFQQNLHLPHHLYHPSTQLLLTSPAGAPAVGYHYYIFNLIPYPLPAGYIYYNVAMEPQLQQSSFVYSPVSDNGVPNGVHNGAIAGEKDGNFQKGTSVRKRHVGFSERTKRRLVQQEWRKKKHAPLSNACSQMNTEVLPWNTTTVMMKNIPNRIKRVDLVGILDEHCREENSRHFHGLDPTFSSYDFLYLPIDFKSGCNLGYAFVNLKTHAAALKIHRSFHGYRWKASSKKVCEITPARIQGVEALKRHFMYSRFHCGNREFLPVVFSPPRDGISLSSSKCGNVIGNCVFSSSSSLRREK